MAVGARERAREIDTHISHDTMLGFHEFRSDLWEILSQCISILRARMRRANPCFINRLHIAWGVLLFIGVPSRGIYCATPRRGDHVSQILSL